MLKKIGRLKKYILKIHFVKLIKIVKLKINKKMMNLEIKIFLSTIKKIIKAIFFLKIKFK
jgi:hypothetical protein